MEALVEAGFLGVELLVDVDAALVLAALVFAALVLSPAPSKHWE